MCHARIFYNESNFKNFHIKIFLPLSTEKKIISWNFTLFTLKKITFNFEISLINKKRQSSCTELLIMLNWFSINKIISLKLSIKNIMQDFLFRKFHRAPKIYILIKCKGIILIYCVLLFFCLLNFLNIKKLVTKKISSGQKVL